MAIRINHKDNSLQFDKVSAPAVNPPAGTVALYFDSTGNLAFKDEAGTESEITSTASNFIGYFNEVAKVQATADGVKAVGLLELTGYATGSLPAGVNGAVVYDTTTNTLKFYNGSIWADSVLKTGDTMTGDLTLSNGASPLLNIRPTSAGGFPGIKIKDSNGIIRATWAVAESSGLFSITRNDELGFSQTTATWTTDGNLTVSGSAPQAINQLTRKDYVDTTTVALDGSRTMTGNLTIGDGTTGRLITVRGFGTSSPGLTMQRPDATSGATLWHDISAGTTLIYQYDADGTTLSNSLSLEADGSIRANFAANPTSGAHLTRKDYVDDNFYESINGSAQTDLDLVITHGIYNYGLWTNLPLNSGSAGSLIVSGRDSNDTTAKTQLYTDSNNKSFFRYGQGASFAWNAWKEIFTTSGGTLTGNLSIAHTAPQLFLKETDAVVDEKNWAFTTDGTIFTFRAYNDAIDSYTTPIIIARTGTAIDAVTLIKPRASGAQEDTISALTRKDYVDDTTVSITGDAMTGDLTVGDGSTANFIAVRASAANAHYWLKRSDNTAIGLMYAEVATGDVRIRRYATNGSTVENEVKLLSDGNVEISGVAPTAINHLTRKDYVDDNFLSHSVFSTTNTQSTDIGKWTKFARVSIPSQYQYSDATVELVAASSGSLVLVSHRLQFRVKQQEAFGSDPYVDVRLTALDGAHGAVAPQIGTIIVQNTPSTIVDMYIQINDSFTTYHGTQVTSKSASPYIEWFSDQVWFASPGAVEYPMELMPNKTYVDTVTTAKNVIINGNMDIWQRGTQFTGIAENAFSTDRFKYRKGGTMGHSIAKSALAPTYAQSGTLSKSSILLDCTTADTTIDAANYSFNEYVVEGYDYARIAGGDATLSFWVYATKTGIHCIGFRNTAGDRSYVAEYTIAASNVWQKVEVTVPLTETAGTWDYENGVGLRIGFILAVGSNFQTTAGAWNTGNFLGTANQVNACDNIANNFRITQIQFEKGSLATSYEYKSIADEVARCQRYFSKSYGIDVAPGTVTQSSQILELAIRNSATQSPGIHFTINMRGTPTVLIYSPVTGTSGKSDNSGEKTTVASGITDSGISHVSITSGVTTNNLLWHYTADAEL